MKISIVDTKEKILVFTSRKIHDTISSQAQDAHELQSTMVNSVANKVVVGSSGSLGASHFIFGRIDKLKPYIHIYIYV